MLNFVAEKRERCYFKEVSRVFLYVIIYMFFFSIESFCLNKDRGKFENENINY